MLGCSPLVEALYPVGWVAPGSRPAFAATCKAYLEQCAIGASMAAMQDLASKDDNMDMVNHIELYEHPSSARPTKVFGKGTLTLVCCSTRVNTTKKDNAIEVKVVKGGDSWILYAHPTTTAPFDGKGKAVDHPFVAPYWFVDSCAGKDGNMTRATAVVKVLQFEVHVPILINAVKVGKQDTLQLLSSSESSEPKKRKVQ